MQYPPRQHFLSYLVAEEQKMQVSLTQTPPVSVGKYGTKYAAWVEVRDQDDKLLGKLHISVGGVEWLPANATHGHWIGWDSFIKQMETSSQD